MGAIFQALLTNRASRVEAPTLAAPVLQTAEESQPYVDEPREVTSVADSDVESDGGPEHPQQHDSDDEPIVPAAKRKKQGDRQAKKANDPMKRPAAASAQPSQPKRRVRRKVASSGQGKE